ncbi:WD repeat and SOCS box-containing protein 1 isoform X2 [Lingula anatina]|uniref:WD repeat and SOCS box-containing protein 1 isoform X2 n=1 Tax=Lingula anatina TaxID=7574 RepID=A0A1S3ILT6_LINAN|nr:WD repeat and SOCS box-containing protein 1 isoform X2 [Lingula anatina]|eukprot:XP_013399182.1 WD repeat and SOCS box-containing protein 1 isoform X2 [Lingula anatina]
MACFSETVVVDDLEQATHLLEFKPPGNNNVTYKSGRETWDNAWAPDGSYFACAFGERCVKVIPWNHAKKTSVKLDNINENGDILTHKGCTIDAGELVWSVAIGSAVSEKIPRTCSINYHHVRSANLMLAIGLNNGRIKIWELDTNKLITELYDHKTVVRGLHFAPDGSLRLASASRDGTIKLWDMYDDGNMYKTLRPGCEWMYAARWSPDCQKIAGVGSARTVVVWDSNTYEVIRKFIGHHHNVVDVDFSPDGALLVTASYDTRAVVWDVYTGDVLLELCHLFPPPRPIYASGANGNHVRGAVFSHDGKHIATICDDGYLRIWTIEDELVPQQIATIPDALCVACSPTGSIVSVGTRDGTTSLFAFPRQVEPLQHLCRMALRTLTPSQSVDKLWLPLKVKEYVKYRCP